MLSSAPLTHYVIVRADLPRGIQAANVIHAAGESSPGNLAEGTHAICLVVPDEPALLAVEEKLRERGVAHVACREPDAPYHGAIMSIGVVPGPKEALRKHLSSSPLLR